MTELFEAYMRAEAAAHAGNSIELWQVANKASAAYNDALKVARKQFRAFPDGVRKDDAITNAYNTEGTSVDELYWFEIAISTYKACSDPQ